MAVAARAVAKGGNGGGGKGGGKGGNDQPPPATGGYGFGGYGGGGEGGGKGGKGGGGGKSSDTHPFYFCGGVDDTASSVASTIDDTNYQKGIDRAGKCLGGWDLGGAYTQSRSSRSTRSMGTL